MTVARMSAEAYLEYCERHSITPQNPLRPKTSPGVARSAGAACATTPNRTMPKTDKAKREFVQQLHLAGIAPPELEHYFRKPRRSRFDYAWLEQKVAVEYEGGVFHGGRHTRGRGFVNDCEKYNEAALLGWIVIRITYDDVFSGRSLGWTDRALKARARS